MLRFLGGETDSGCLCNRRPSPNKFHLKTKDHEKQSIDYHRINFIHDSIGAVNLAVANDKSTSMNGIEIQANHFEALNHKTTNSVATSYQEKKALRPIKRKFRFRRNALRCPGF